MLLQLLQVGADLVRFLENWILAGHPPKILSSYAIPSDYRTSRPQVDKGLEDQILT